MELLKILINCCVLISLLSYDVDCKGTKVIGKTKQPNSKKQGNNGDTGNKKGHTLQRNHFESSEGRLPPIGYDPTESGHHKPLHVNLTLWIEAVMDVDLSAMEYTMHVYIILEWYDLRLAGVRNHSVVLRDRTLIFVPDPYCVNCKSPSLNANTNEFQLRIHPDGFVYYSQSITVSPTCRMSLRHFPFDWHRCRFELSSYAHNDSYLKMHWAREIVITETKLQQFTITGNVKKQTRLVKYISGNFTVNAIVIEIKREQGFYVLQVYVPCIILVLLSWIIFYIGPDQVGDRLAIGVTLILTMIFLLGYVNGSLPKVSYIKAIDWYMIVALFLIAASLIETVFVYWHWHIYADEGKHSFSREVSNRGSVREGIDITAGPEEEEKLKPLTMMNGRDNSKQNGISHKVNIHETVLSNVDSHLLPSSSTSASSGGDSDNQHETANVKSGGRGIFSPSLRRRILAVSLINTGQVNIKEKLSNKMKKPKTSKNIDKFSRFFFPLVFSIYNTVYFVNYHKASDFFGSSNDDNEIY